MININQKMSELSDNLGMTLGDLCDLAEISPATRGRVAQDFKKIPLINFFKLSDTLGIDFDRMVHGQLDYRSLREHYQGNLQYIPEKYQVYKRSKVSTINNFFQYVSTKIPNYYIDKIMKRLQIKKESFQDPNMDISGTLLMDLFKELAQSSKDDSYFFEIG